MKLYTDLTTNKLSQVLDPYNPQGAENDDQKKLGVGDGPFHEEEVLQYMVQFNELLASMSTKVMYSLMTWQQKQVAKSWWEACNYGGKPKPGDLKHMEDRRKYYEWVLRLDHIRQWEFALKNVKIPAEP